MFRVGRVIATVDATVKDARSMEDHAYFTEALGIGIEYLLQQHPKVGAIPSKACLFLAGQPNEEVILLKDTAVGECRLLKEVGVQVAEQRDSEGWSVRLARDRRWVKVKAFSWEMETEKGKVRLERPVFPIQGGFGCSDKSSCRGFGVESPTKRSNDCFACEVALFTLILLTPL